MKKQPLLLTFFAALALQLPCMALQTTPAAADKPAAHRDAATRSHEGNSLPETASALPLLSTIGAGVLLGGLVSARRTRSSR